MCQSFDCYWEMDIIDLLLLDVCHLSFFFFFFFWVHLMLLMNLGSSLLIPLESLLGTLHMSLSFSFCWYWLQLIALLMPTPCQKKQNIVILIWLNSFFRSNVSRFWKVYYSFCICRWLLSMLLGFSTIAYLLYVLTWLTLCTDFDCSLIFGLFLLTRKTRSLPYAGPVLVLAK